MLYTPAALELALRCPLTTSLSGGEDDKPETAESILLRGAVSVDMIAVLLRLPCRQQDKFDS